MTLIVGRSQRLPQFVTVIDKFYSRNFKILESIVQAYRANNNPANKGQANINDGEVLFIRAINVMTFQSPDKLPVISSDLSAFVPNLRIPANLMLL